MKPQLSMERDS